MKSKEQIHIDPKIFGITKIKKLKPKLELNTDNLTLKSRKYPISPFKNLHSLIFFSKMIHFYKI